jgi:hypothetical protein
LPSTLIGVIHTDDTAMPSISAMSESERSIGKRSRTRKAVRAKRPGPKASDWRSSTNESSAGSAWRKVAVPIVGSGVGCLAREAEGVFM